MTTARKPVQSPKPAITRAPAKSQPEPKNPVTTEIMQRVRRVISKSEGLITIASIAAELDVSRSKLTEWIGCWRSSPSGDNLMAIVRWLIQHDTTFDPEVLKAKKIRFRGDVLQISTRGQPNRTMLARHSPFHRPA